VPNASDLLSRERWECFGAKRENNVMERVPFQYLNSTPLFNPTRAKSL
jgi:hypothetical protein